jgi:peptidoglycan/xylan/chitin deacetylase (PgdA/CDA1 family)
MFRLDRFLTLYFVWPLIRNVQIKKNRISILMYHGICEPELKNKHPYYETSTSAKVFGEHLRFLQNNHYNVIGLNQIGTLREEGDGNKSTVIITFDDGYLNFYTNAYRILEKFRCTATVFIPTGLMGKRLKNFDLMSWDHVRELSKFKINFGSHSVNHTVLINLGQESLINEIFQSKIHIEEQIKTPVDAFAYPFAFPEENGRFVRSLRRVLKDCGYSLCLTTSIGREKHPAGMFLKRIPVNNYDDILFLKAKIDGAYDWVHSLQISFKLGRKLIMERRKK